MTATPQVQAGYGSARITVSHPTTMGEVRTLPRIVAAVVLTVLALSMPFRASGSRRGRARQLGRVPAWDRGAEPGRGLRLGRGSAWARPRSLGRRSAWARGWARGRGTVWGRRSIWERSRRPAWRSASLERPSTDSRWPHPPGSLSSSGKPDPPDLHGRSSKRGRRVRSNHRVDPSNGQGFRFLDLVGPRRSGERWRMAFRRSSTFCARPAPAPSSAARIA